MSQNSLDLNNNSSTVFQHNFTSQVWHESQSKLPSSYDLSKSMIKKIPGLKRPMSDHLEIMLLFQAAQIERLTDNLQVLRNYKREMQKGPMNLKSMQIQVKQLTDEIFRKEKQIVLLKEKYEAALKNLSEYDMSNRQLERKLREKLIEVRQLREELEEKDLTVSESVKLTDEKEIYIKKLNDSIFFMSKQKDQLQQKNDEYLDKLALLSQQMVRLRESNNKMKSSKGSVESQLQQLKQQNFTLKSLMQKQQAQNELLHKMSLKLQEQIDEFKSTINYMKQTQEHTNLQKSSHILMTEQRNEHFFNENGQLKTQLMQCMRKINQKEYVIVELNNKYQRGTEQLNNVKKQLWRVQQVQAQQESAYSLLKQQNRELQYNLQSEKSYFSQEMSHYDSMRRQDDVTKQGEITELGRENRHLNAEVARLAGIVEKIAEEKSELNTTLNSSLEELSRQIEEREILIREKQLQINEFQRNIQHLSMTSRQAGESMSGKVQQLSTKIQQLTKRLQEQLNVNEKLKNEINRVNRQKDQIIRELQHKEMSNSSINLRYETLMEDVQRRDVQIDELRREKERMGDELEDRDGEVNQVRQELSNRLNQLTNLKTEFELQRKQLENKNFILNQLKHQIDFIDNTSADKEKHLLANLRQLDTQVNEQGRELNEKQRMIHQMQVMMQERQNIIHEKEMAIGEKERVIHEMRIEIQRRETAVRQKQRIIHEMEAAMHEKEQIIHEREITIGDKDQQLLHFKQRYMTLENQLTLVTHELERLNMMIREKDGLLMERMQEIGRLVKTQQESKFEVKSLRQTISRKEIQLTQKESYESGVMDKLLRQMNELKRVLVDKDEELVKCNEYILRTNQRIAELSMQQASILRSLQASSLQSNNSERESYRIAQSNHQLLDKVFQLLRQVKAESLDNFTALNKGIEDKHSVVQSNHYEVGQKLGIVQTLLSSKNKQLQTKNTQLISSLESRSSQISSLEQKLAQLTQRNNNESKYIELLNQLNSIKAENLQVKSIIRNISLSSHSQQQQRDQQINSYKQQLEAKSYTINELHSKIDVIYKEMQELIGQFESLSIELNSYKQIRQTQQSQRSQLIDNVKLQTEQQCMKQLRQMQITLKTQIQQLHSYNRSLIQQNNRIKEQNSTLQNQNTLLKQQNNKFQHHINEVEHAIIQKRDEITKFHQMITRNNEQYIKKSQYEKSQLDSKIRLMGEEIAKFEMILKVRQQQVGESQIVVTQMSGRIKELQSAQTQKDGEIKRLKGVGKRVQELQSQIQTLLQEKDQSITEEELYSQLNPLKRAVNQLQTMNHNLHSRLQQALAKLSSLSQQLAKIQANESAAVQRLQSLLEIEIKYQESLKQLETVQLQKSELQLLLVKRQSQIKQLQIDQEFNTRMKSNTNVVYSKYEAKLRMLMEESQKFSRFIQLLESENNGLKRQKSLINLELKKAQMAQEKIRILSQEIDRLSIEKIDLDSELTNYKLQLSEDSSMERRQQEQLCLMVLMFAEIEALRARLKSKEEEVEQTHRTYMRSTSSSRYH